MSPEIPSRVESIGERVLDRIGDNQISIAVGVLVGGALIWRYGIPDWLITLSFGVLYGLLPAYVVGLIVVAKLFPDNRREIVELDLQDEEDGSITAQSWFVPEALWRDRDRGDRSEIMVDKGAEAIVTDLDHMQDIDKISVEGCNDELADPISMIARDGQLEEIYQNLIDKAEQLDKLEATLRSKALDIQRQNVHAILAAVEQGTQMDPGAVESTVEDLDLRVDSDPADLSDDHDQDQDQLSYDWDRHRNNGGPDPLEERA